jgi:hypothetical protein
VSLSPRDALAQKLDALASIARAEGWCDGAMQIFATPHREFRETGVYTDDARTLLSVRCGWEQANGSFLLASQQTGWEDAEPFLLLATAALVLDGHTYNAQVSLPNGPVAVQSTPGLGTAHDRLACRSRMERHLESLGWKPGLSIGSYDVIDQALTAITKALPDCRK